MRDRKDKRLKKFSRNKSSRSWLMDELILLEVFLSCSSVHSLTLRFKKDSYYHQRDSFDYRSFSLSWTSWHANHSSLFTNWWWEQTSSRFSLFSFICISWLPFILKKQSVIMEGQTPLKAKWTASLLWCWFLSSSPIRLESLSLDWEGPH